MIILVTIIVTLHFYTISYWYSTSDKTSQRLSDGVFIFKTIRLVQLIEQEVSSYLGQS